MTRALVAVGVLVAALVGGLAAARALELLPTTRPAPGTVLYVAISRSEDETAAQEIEMIETATGERTLIDVGVRVSALALTADRRTLLVGTDDGRLLLLDPNTGGRIAEVVTRRPTYLLPVADRPLAISIHSTPEGGAVTVIDLGARREAGALSFPRALGRPSQQGGRVLVPSAAGGANDLYEIDVEPLSLTRTIDVARLSGRTRSGLPQTHSLADGSVAFLAQWESGLSGARLFVGVGNVPTSAREIQLVVRSPLDDRPLRGLREVQTALAAAADGSLHACVGSAEIAARYRVDPSDLRAELVGAECGAFARTTSGELYLAVRGKPSLAMLDVTGRTVRTLPLPGIPVAVAY